MDMEGMLVLLGFHVGLMLETLCAYIVFVELFGFSNTYRW